MRHAGMFMAAELRTHLQAFVEKRKSGACRVKMNKSAFVYVYDRHMAKMDIYVLLLREPEGQVACVSEPPLMETL